MADSPRSKLGTLGSIEIRLADWRPRPYQHYLLESYEERQDIAGTDVRAEAQRARVREWKIDDWSGGFGYPIWTQATPNRYNAARNVCPEYRDINYSGLVLGPEVATASDDSPTTFVPASPGYLWYGSLPDNTYLTVYGTKTQAIHPWLDSTSNFDATAVTAGSASGVARGIADPGDGYLYVLDSADNDIYKVDADGASNVLHTDRSAITPQWGGSNTAITAFRGEVYVLGGGGDLHRIDRSTTNTSTRVVDAFYASGGTSILYDAVNRIVSSDVGPLWFHPTRYGTDVWEYNAAEDSASIIFQLGPNAHPWSIAFVGGFVFVAYSEPINRSIGPNLYLRYFRGGQSGVLGPFTNVADGYLPSIAGTYQDRFILFTADHVQAGSNFDLWVYDLGEGALHHWAEGALQPLTSGAGAHSRLLGQDVLVQSNDDGNRRVEVVSLDQYATLASGNAYLTTGRYDFDMPGVQKLLMEINVLTEPLPANTTIEIQYSLDGGSWQDNSLDITTDGVTSTTFDLTGENDSFYELELRIFLTSTSSSATPTIRGITTRALPTAVEEYWDLEIDMNSQMWQTSGDTIHTPGIISALQALKTNKQVVTFTNPWEVDNYIGESSLTDSVTVVSVRTPDAHAAETDRYASLRLRKATLS